MGAYPLPCGPSFQGGTPFFSGSSLQAPFAKIIRVDGPASLFPGTTVYDGASSVFHLRISPNKDGRGPCSRIPEFVPNDQIPFKKTTQMDRHLQCPAQPEEHEAFVIPADRKGGRFVDTPVQKTAVEVERIEAVLDLQKSRNHDVFLASLRPRGG